MPLPPEVEASYSAIIDSILAASDLHTVSAKKIRKGLQAQVSYDITPQKGEITDLIMQRFDKFTEQQKPVPTTEGPTNLAPTADAPATTNGANGTSKSGDTQSTPSSPKKRSERSAEDDESELSEVVDFSPPKKKHKKNASVDDDAAFAARLQAEENARSRPTRGGVTRKRGLVTKKAGSKKKAKSARKIKSDDDSEVEDRSGGEKKEVKRTGGFHKPMTLSAPLSELLGETQLSRPQTVKKIWEYVKERDLQDPSDKRQIRCDDAMKKVFKQDRVHMFTMNKILNQNLYAQDE